MLTNLEVYSSQTSPPDLPLVLGSREDTDLIHIREITGLGPVKANIGTRQYGSMDGEFFTGSSVGKRNIVITVGFNPDWVTHTVSTLRHMLYAYFMTKQYVRLRFFRDDGPTVDIDGYVESCEPNIFSKDAEMQMSVICPLPDFVGASPSIVEGQANNAPVSVDFSLVGNAATPVLFELTAPPAAVPYEGIVNIEHKTLALSARKFSLIGSVSPGLKLIVNSVRGTKKAENVVVSTGEVINLLNTLTADSTWTSLEPGVNKIKVFTEVAANKPWKLTYYERFGGL